jgi:hypothetical protein
MIEENQLHKYVHHFLSLVNRVKASEYMRNHEKLTKVLCQAGQLYYRPPKIKHIKVL